MKYLNKILGILLIALYSCNSVKKQSNNQYDDQKANIMFFTVTDIQDEKDGQTIFMIDDSELVYTMIISPANGNWIELKTEDRIQVKIEEVLESDPPQIISQYVKVVDDVSSTKIEYERIEEETYFINSRKVMGSGIWDQITECLEFKKGETLNELTQWEMLCDEIEYFNFREGYFYQIKVQKKWLKNHENLMDRTPYDLELIEVVSKEKDTTYLNPIVIDISTNQSAFNVGEPIELNFEIKNTGEKSFTFLPWQTPLEGTFTADCLEIMFNDTVIPYSGIMVKRVAPTVNDYLTLQHDETLSEKVNILEGYKLLEKGSYSIKFKESYSGLPNSNIIRIELQ